MGSNIFQTGLRNLAIAALILGGGAAASEPRHGIAMYGDPALPPDFVSLPYVNADAPRGGSIVLGNTGGFDSLNPFVRKGTAPWQLAVFTHESLMGRTLDEPFTLYGLLAESVEVSDDRTEVRFVLRPEAAFSDGTPVTVEDVIWSYETLGTEGHPKYHGLWDQITSITQDGPRAVKMTFEAGNRELALLAGMRPILSKAQWDGRDFANAPLADVPLGSGPYVVSAYEGGRFVQLTRDPDYWGADVPVRRGTNNYDKIRIDFYGDSTVLLEGFKAGEISAIREFNAERWTTQYDFPRALSGDVVQTEIPHGKPSGMTGLAMNTRRAPFDDWRVRAALIYAFNFEYINDTVTGGAQPRITSYFSNSVLAMQDGPAAPEVAALLKPYAADLPQGTLEGYALPVSDGSARNRRNLRVATKLLQEAGFSAEGGTLRDSDGSAFTFDILLPKGSTENIAIADIYVGALARLGITARIETVDDAQFLARTNSFDFEMTYFRRALSLSPGNEQRYYWSSEAASAEGSRNLPGIASPAVDAMIDAMLEAEGQEQFVSATRALDRVLTAGSYVIPFWQFSEGRIAHVKQMKHPEVLPIYGDGPNYMPEVWWWED
ncbi:nickel-binding periplasmic protein [Pseudosulfitobacter pseudonitzschiae]|uniref:Nickel-binding periplasmic protein n=2 Tax=Rhodobacterales TaxID=204455 RepID=A0A221K0J0_9RHOB|nr:nickel-binding periplasmic protein [Pseudosulfitobacter pseudonitzschiae]